MKTAAELLTRLEDVSARAVEITGTNTEPFDCAAALPLIEERDALLTELNDVLQTSQTLSYIEWNRLVIIHFQGNRILENLLGFRSQAAVAWADNARAQAFIQRVSGTVGQPWAEHLSETA